jgi:hypothetical protein
METTATNEKFTFGTIVLEGVLLACCEYLEKQSPASYKLEFLWAEVGLMFTIEKNSKCNAVELEKWKIGNKLVIKQFFYENPPYPFHLMDDNTVYYRETGKSGKKFLNKFKVNEDDYNSLVNGKGVTFKTLKLFGVNEGVVIPEKISTIAELLDLFQLQLFLPTAPLVKGWKRNGFLGSRVFVDSEGEEVFEIQRIVDSDSDGEIPKMKALPILTWGKVELKKWLSLGSGSAELTLLEYITYHCCKVHLFYESIFNFY